MTSITALNCSLPHCLLPACSIIRRPCLQTAPGAVKLRALAVRLSNAPGSPPGAYHVYTPDKSASAFILGCAIARSSVNQHLIW